jgi:hypothetical protein
MLDGQKGQLLMYPYHGMILVSWLELPHYQTIDKGTTSGQGTSVVTLK